MTSPPVIRELSTDRENLSKSHRRFEDVGNRLLNGSAAVAYWLLLTVVCTLPWLLGGNRLPFLLLATMLLLVATVAAYIARWRSGLPDTVSLLSGLPLLLAVVWLSPAVAALKRGWIASSGVGAGHDIHLEFFAFSVALGNLAIFLLLPCVITDVKKIKSFVVVILVAAVLHVLYATYVFTGGERFLFWLASDLRALANDNGVLRGNFSNRNHFAAQMSMLLFLCLGLLIGYYLRNAKVNSRRPWWHRLVRISLGPEGKLRAIMIILTAGVVMTFSRTANILVLSTLIFISIMLYWRLPKARKAIAVLVASIAIIDIALISNLVGLEKVADRIAATNIATEQRVDFNNISVDMLSDYWLTGIGGGNYVSFVNAYKGLHEESYFIYAHNDVLQMAVELGVPLFLLLVMFVLYSIVSGIRAFLTRSNPFCRGVGIGAACAVLYMSFHAFTDFNHQIPANSFLFVVCCALCQICERVQSVVR